MDRENGASKDTAALTRLTVAVNAEQRALIEETLRVAELPFSQRELPHLPSTYGIFEAAGGFLAPEEFLVDPARIDAARDRLFAEGLLCDASEATLRRALQEIVKPLLLDETSDPTRLLRCLEVNSKGVVRSLLDATIRLSHGRELLETFFFRLARTLAHDTPALETGRHTLPLKELARTLRVGADAAFTERFHADATLGEPGLRLVLLDVLPEMPANSWRQKALVAALRDRESNIREAGGEALHELGRSDLGYDPADPPAEREEIVRKLLTSARG